MASFSRPHHKSHTSYFHNSSPPLPPIDVRHLHQFVCSSHSDFSMAEESEISHYIFAALRFLLALVLRVGKLVLTILVFFVKAAWNFAVQLMQGQQPAARVMTANSEENLRKKVTPSKEMAVPKDPSQQQTQTSVGTTEYGSEPVGPKKEDPFWNVSTLPTSRYPDIPANEHAPKYAPDYDTLANLDNNAIFPQKKD